MSRRLHRLSAVAAGGAALLLAGCLAAEAASTPVPGGRIRTAGWIECRTEHFEIYSNAGEGKTRKVAVQLERFRQALGRITQGFQLDTHVPTSTFVFRSDSAYRPYKQNASGETMNVSGYFLPRPFRNYITLDVSAGARPMRVVYHEFFHAVMDASLGALPTWLNEGLAEYFSTFEDRAGTAIVEVGHPIDEHLRHLAAHGTIPWEEVFETTPDSPTYNEGKRQGAFYAQSWLLVHYLNATDERSRALGRYLSLLRSGAEDDAAFAEAFGTSRAAMGRAVEEYRENGSSYVWWDFGEQHGDVAVEVEKMTEAEVLFRLGELLAQRGQTEAAEAHLERAAVAGWPIPEVRTAWGVTAYYSDRKPAAAKTLRAAIEIGAPTAEPYVLLAWLLFERAGAVNAGRPGVEAPPAIREIREIFEMALARDENGFHALSGLARTYLFEGGDTSPGVAALERAQALRPLDLDTLQVQASLLGRAGEVGRAWSVIDDHIAPRDAEMAQDTVGYVVNGVIMAAAERAEAGERGRAIDLLDQALAVVAEPDAVAELRGMREAFTSGQRVVFGGGPDEERTKAAVDAYNRAIDIASSGDHDAALAIFDEIVAECVEPELCNTARDTAADLRRVIERGRFIGRYNEVVRLVNGGKRNEAVEVLKELEAVAPDAEALSKVRDLLRALGENVTKAE